MRSDSDTETESPGKGSSSEQGGDAEAWGEKHSQCDLGYVKLGCHQDLPNVKEQQLHGCRRAKSSYSTFRVRRGGLEEIPLVQVKEQRLCFAEAATSKVRETQVRNTETIITEN